MLSEKNLSEKIIIVCILCFLGLCTLHFSSQRPLWNDEEALLVSLQVLSNSELFGRLQHSQVFPRVHLILIKSFSQISQFHVLSLRAFSFLFMLTAFYLWIRIYKKHCADAWFFCLAVCAFAASYKMSYYAAEFKPYALDVLVAALYFLYLNNQKRLLKEKPMGKDYVLTFLMPLLIFFSYAGLFVFWIGCVNLLLVIRKNKNVISLFMLSFLSCIFFFTVFYLIDLRHTTGIKGVQGYWESYFICSDSIRCFFDTFGEGIKRIATSWYGTSKIFVKLSVIFIPFYIFALFRYGIEKWKKDGGGIFQVESLSLVLFLELLIFGLLHKYPFTGGRITLFYAPFVFYMTLLAIFRLRDGKLLKRGFIAYVSVFYFICLMNSFVRHLSWYQ